jgi:hypothetical protein
MSSRIVRFRVTYQILQIASTLLMITARRPRIGMYVMKVLQTKGLDWNCFEVSLRCTRLLLDLIPAGVISQSYIVIKALIDLTLIEST